MAERERSPLRIVPRFETLKNGIPYTQTVNGRKHGVFFRNGGETCGAIRRRGESSITMRRSVIIPSFTAIACKLREEFANIGFELSQLMKCCTLEKSLMTMEA